MLDKVVGVLFNPVSQTVIMALLGLIFAGFKQYRSLYKELMDIPKRVREAKKKNSPGGADITDEEWAQIGKEIVEAMEATAKIDWKAVFKRKK